MVEAVLLLQATPQTRNMASGAVLATAGGNGKPKLAERPVWKPRDTRKESLEVSRYDNRYPDTQQLDRGDIPTELGEGDIPKRAGLPTKPEKKGLPMRTGRVLPRGKKQAGSTGTPTNPQKKVRRDAQKALYLS